MTKWLPILQELQKNPELAPLAVLDSALDVACHAIHAEHPHVHDSRAIFGTDRPLLSFLVAREILNLAERLQECIWGYKQRLKEEQDEYEDLPF